MKRNIKLGSFVLLIAILIICYNFYEVRKMVDIGEETNMNSNKIINLGTGSAAADAVRLDQIYALSGDTYAWTCPGQNFMARYPDTDQVHYSITIASITAEVDGPQLVAPVFLPHGATVTAVIIYGSNAEMTWHMKRGLLTTGVGSVMADDDINSADTSITDAVIDNNSYSYYLATSEMFSGDGIYGAKIIYQLP